MKLNSLRRTVGARLAWLVQGRFRALAHWLLLIVALNAVVRLGLTVYNADATLLLPWRLGPALAIGALFDTGVALCFAVPLALLIGLWPRSGLRLLALLCAAAVLAMSLLLLFVAASEFTFWNEFASRFNFIAVDYLIYTNEVIGNIRESYNLPLMLAAIGVLALLLGALAIRVMTPALVAQGGAGWRTRWAVTLVWLLMPAVAMAVLDSRFKEFSSNAQLNELAGNGIFDFLHAFRGNEIDYERFYRTLPRQKAVAKLAAELSGRLVVTLSQRPYDRQIANPGPERHKNVVLVSIESLSASFMSSFGNAQGLTPNLDRLADQGLLFTRLYATGTRTVRGLEALALSVPPTPGHSIVKRPDNANMFTLGEVFNSRGYESLYMYGGYGYFDNMNAFFSGNGYAVIDRTALNPQEIHFENVWGVADEDLFTLALRELDDRHARHVPFFAHIMTTSNHRPFTYPQGRVDIPSRTGREGGVKYTDWAIGDFVERARAHAWFDDTVFVLVADHTHNSRGRTELPPANYHIPLIIYAPGFVAPGRHDVIASQIDVAPTLLGLLNFSYRSRFFGADMLREGRDHARALMANYQTVGYYEAGRVVELRPNGRARVVEALSGQTAPDDELTHHLLDEAVSYYQLASEAYRLGHLKLAQ